MSAYHVSGSRIEQIFRIARTNSHLLYDECVAHVRPNAPPHSRPKSLIVSISVVLVRLAWGCVCGKCQRVGSEKAREKEGNAREGASTRSIARSLSLMENGAKSSESRTPALYRFYSGTTPPILSSSPLMIIIQLRCRCHLSLPGSPPNFDSISIKAEDCVKLNPSNSEVTF